MPVLPRARSRLCVQLQRWPPLGNSGQCQSRGLSGPRAVLGTFPRSSLSPEPRRDRRTVIRISQGRPGAEEVSGLAKDTPERGTAGGWQGAHCPSQRPAPSRRPPGRRGDSRQHPPCLPPACLPGLPVARRFVSPQAWGPGGQGHAFLTLWLCHPEPDTRGPLT